MGATADLISSGLALPWLLGVQWEEDKFALVLLKAAGIGKKEAKTMGIAVDHRRVNKSVESLQENTQRLKEYKSKLILFPLNSKKPRKGEATADEISKATQLAGKVMPLKPVVKRQKAMVITEDMKNFKAFNTIRQASACPASGPRRPRRPKPTTCPSQTRSKLCAIVSL